MDVLEMLLIPTRQVSAAMDHGYDNGLLRLRLKKRPVILVMVVGWRLESDGA